jgi:hypothetical protein
VTDPEARDPYAPPPGGFWRATGVVGAGRAGHPPPAPPPAGLACGFLASLVGESGPVLALYWC